MAEQNEKDLMATRDLSFKPVDNPRPKILTAAQIEHYNQFGYLKPFRIFDEAGVKKNRDFFDGLLEENRREGHDSYAINAYHVECAGIYDLAVHPLILEYVGDILGPNIICWGTHYFCKLPRDPKSVPWHQDASYWPFTPARTVTVWLAIDDADVENACMHVIPGTHKLGHLKWNEAREPAVLNQKVENAEKYGKPAPFELKAGEMSLHADMLVHGSTPNTSGRRRCGLTMRYCPPEVLPLNKGWASKAILCRGEDRTGHWAHAVRPANNSLSAVWKQRRVMIGAN